MDKRTLALSGSVVVALLLLGMGALGGPSDASRLTTTRLSAELILGEDDGPPGFNGTIKVHDGTTESEPIVANEPHVGCDLHIHGFDFDGSAGGSWRIVAWPPTGDQSSVRWSGTWSTGGGAGDWRTELLSASSSDMVEGRAHFKIFVDQSGAPGGEKAKVFWIACQSLTLEAPPVLDAAPTLTSAPTAAPIGSVTLPDPYAGPVFGAVPTPAIALAVAPAIGSVTLPTAVAGVERPAGVGSLAALPATSTADPSGDLALLVAFLAGIALYVVRPLAWRS